jgi:large subunit ribosomal protein L15
LFAANVLSMPTKTAKIILAGTVSKPFTIQGLAVTRGARQAIEAVGGRIE